MSTILVVGCGIVGPVISLLLKRKGYPPIIVEKVKAHGDAGLSLGLFPNGLKVLSVIGLNDFGVPFPKGTESTSAGEYLGTFDQTYFAERYGFRACGVARSVLQKRLRDEAARQGIPVHQGWELQELQQDADGIKATSTDGREISASFAIGYDGLHSVTRRLVLQNHSVSEPAADSTGVVMRQKRRRTGKQPTISKSRKQLDDLKDWPQPIRDMIGGTEKLVKFGLYDRPAIEPEHWFYGRCVLVGDAAHPTSPHFGQGASQSLEDCWHLSQLLPDASGDLSAESLTAAFRRYAENRQPKNAALVKGARAQGQMRVMHGKEACQQRNEQIKQMWADESAVRERMHPLYKEPF